MSYFYLYFFFINQLTVLSNELFVSSKPKTKPHKISKEIFLGDPTILIESNKYYLYGSSAGGIDSTANGFLVYESSNLKNWEPKGYALKKRMHMEKVGSGHHKFLKKMVCFIWYMLQMKILVWQL